MSTLHSSDIMEKGQATSAVTSTVSSVPLVRNQTSRVEKHQAVRGRMGSSNRGISELCSRMFPRRKTRNNTPRDALISASMFVTCYPSRRR